MSKQSALNGFVPVQILIFLAGIIGLLVLTLNFFAMPSLVLGSNVPTFKNGEIVLAEKLTYLFRKPKLGDRVIFKLGDAQINYVGIITNIAETWQGDAYDIRGGEYQQEYGIGRASIIARIYYPALSQAEALKAGETKWDKQIKLERACAEYRSAQKIQPPTTSFEETASLTTFTSKYGYAIKFPSDYEAHQSDWVECTMQYGLQEDDEAVIREKQPYFKFPAVTISLKIPEKNPQNLSAREWVDKNMKFSDETTVVIEDITVDDIKSVGITDRIEGKNTFLVIPYKSKIYKISSSPSGGYEEISDKILSTFKFLK